MMNKCLDYLAKYKEKINKFLVIFLASYMALLILPYIFGRVEAINDFFSGGWSKAIYRLFVMSYAFIYLALVGLSNRIKVKWYYLVGAGALLLILLISSIFSPKDIYKLDGTLGTHISPWEYIYNFIHFFISVSLFVFIISFIHPIMDSIKVFNVALLILIGVTTFAVLLSFFLEGEELLILIKGGDAHAKDVRSIFQNKNTFGLFLFLSSIASAFLIIANSDNTKFISLYLILLLNTFLATIIGCRTAFICSIVLVFYLFVYSLIIMRKYSKKAFVIASSIIGAIILLFTLYMAIPALHQEGMDSLYNIVVYSFLRLDDAFDQREYIWSQVPSIMQGIYIPFGANFSNSAYLLVSYTHHFRDYHSAYVAWFVQMGVLGTIIYASLFGYIFYQIYRVIRKNLEQGLLVLVIFLTSILYGIPETHTLFISTSLFTFVTNLVIVVYLQYLLKEETEK